MSSPWQSRVVNRTSKIPRKFDADNLVDWLLKVHYACLSPEGSQGCKLSKIENFQSINWMNTAGGSDQTADNRSI